MTKEQIQARLADVEARFNEIEQKRQASIRQTQACVEEQLRLQGEFRSLKMLEAEMEKPKEAPPAEEKKSEDQDAKDS